MLPDAQAAMILHKAHEIAPFLQAFTVLTPVLLVGALVMMARIDARLTLLVLATDPSSTRDIPKFCSFLGHQLLEQEEQDGNYRYLLRKGG